MRPDAKSCRYHPGVELMTDGNGIPFCRHCRHDTDAVRQQIKRGAIDTNDDPEERRTQLAEQLGASR